MDDYSGRKIVGKALRNPISNLGISLAIVFGTMHGVFPMLFESPDEALGPNHEQSVERLDSLYNNLSQQRNAISKAKDEFAFIDMYSDDITKQKKGEIAELTSDFNSNIRDFVLRVHADGNISEQNAMSYMEDLEGSIVNDLEKVGFNSFDDAFQDKHDAYAALRECRVDNPDYLRDTQSCMAEESSHSGLLSFILAVGIGGTIGTLGGKVRNSANTREFKDWENGVGKHKKVKKPSHRH